MRILCGVVLFLAEKIIFNIYSTLFYYFNKKIYRQFDEIMLNIVFGNFYINE